MCIKTRKNQWNKKLFKEIWIRFLNAVFSIYFIVFFIIGILFFGTMGIWIPHFRNENNILLNSEALFTYSIAMLGTLVVEFFINAEKNTLSLLALLLGVIAIAFLGYGYYDAPLSESNYTIWGTIFTLLLFVLVNANDGKFDEITNLKASTTGYIEAEEDNIKDIK